MPKFTISCERLVGFAAETGEPGQDINVLVKGSFTSEDPAFHIYIEHISNIFFGKIAVQPGAIVKALILLHEDNTADIYINDFAERVQVRVTRDIKAGEKVYKQDISEIVDLKFENIEVKSTDVIIFIPRESWRFGLYFDYTRELNLENLSQELAALKYKLLFESSVSQLTAAKSGGEFKAFIFTEGKTDRQHLVKALQQTNINLPVEFAMSQGVVGDVMLLKMCEAYAQKPQSNKVIFLFDRDNPEIIRKLESKTESGKSYQSWGNNVYSLMIPTPSHRQDQKNVCIEFYYQDDEIKQADKNGRRMFLSNEFDSKSFKLKANPRIHTNQQGKVKSDIVSLIDEGVFDENGNCALP